MLPSAPKKRASPSGGGVCWPSPSQEILLRACFLAGDAAARELEAWRQEIHAGDLDDFSRRLLPLLIHRWGRDQLDEEIAELGTRIHLAQWEQNRRRFEIAASIEDALAAAGIECVFLKGVALLSRFYGDFGLRGMGDVDLLVRKGDVGAAAQELLRDGWSAEDDLSPGEIGSQTRVRHAWQFVRGDGEMCDLHWHPLVRCFHPEVAERFWSASESVPVANRIVRIPCATDQLFHVCAHGVQWSWTPQTRWIPDAMTILASVSVRGGAINWQRLFELSVAARMTVRLHAALDYLRRRLDAPVPLESLRRFSQHPAEEWERREHRLLQEPCPLGALDSVRWHATNFRRIRPYDEAWSKQPVWLGFPRYLRLFLRAGGTGSILTLLASEFKKRAAISRREE
jgi:hypothetical protein